MDGDGFDQGKIHGEFRAVPKEDIHAFRETQEMRMNSGKHFQFLHSATSVHFANATETARIVRPPFVRSSLAHAVIVEPVVITSSTRMNDLPRISL